MHFVFEVEFRVLFLLRVRRQNGGDIHEFVAATGFAYRILLFSELPLKLNLICLFFLKKSFFLVFLLVN